MKYYTDLFSPETYEAFSKSDKTISGFRTSQNIKAERVNVGDKLICYVTRISRWVGVLEVLGKSFEDHTPIFDEKDDPFIVRFKVKPIVWLRLEQSLPIHEQHIWKELTFTRGTKQNTSNWTGTLRNSLRELNQADGTFLEKILIKQVKGNALYELSENDLKKIQVNKIRTSDDKEVVVSIPDESEEEIEKNHKQIRESLKIQAILAEMGQRMGFKIWIPRNDRSRVLNDWKPDKGILLENLPLNYGSVTLKTIENIDVIWIKRSSIVRAFEVEHKTSIYSGILRMADLLALQPNIQIKLHIVAPLERREKVFQEIKRPVFAQLEKGPLYDSCSFLSYDSIRELFNEKRLDFMKDEVIEEYTESAVE